MATKEWWEEAGRRIAHVGDRHAGALDYFEQFLPGGDEDEAEVAYIAGYLAATAVVLTEALTYCQMQIQAKS